MERIFIYPFFHVVYGVKLINTHNGQKRNKSAKKFKILVSMSLSGPWEEALGKTELEDSRQQEDPLPLQEFVFSSPQEIRFIKFILLSNWGSPNEGGGLQYFYPLLGKTDN